MDLELIVGSFAGLFLFLGIFVIGLVIFYIISLWKVFQKAGRNGWEAIIPFYNTWVLAEIAGVAWWYPLIIIIYGFDIFGESDLSILLNIASLVANFFICYNLSKKFHKDTGFAVLLFFFAFVMMPIIAFSKEYQYDKDVEVNENGPIGENKNTSTNEQNNNYYYETKQYCSYCGKPITDDDKYCGNCGNEIKK